MCVLYRTCSIFLFVAVVACCEACCNSRTGLSESRVGDMIATASFDLDRTTQLILPTYIASRIAGTVSPISVTTSPAEHHFPKTTSPLGFVPDGSPIGNPTTYDTITIHTVTQATVRDTTQASTSTTTSTVTPSQLSTLPGWWDELRVTLLVFAVALFFFILITILRT